MIWIDIVLVDMLQFIGEHFVLLLWIGVALSVAFMCTDRIT